MPGFYVTGEIWNIFDNNKLRISAYLWRHLECINKTRDASVFLSIQRPTRLSWRGALRTILSPHIGAIRWTISSKFIVRGLPCLCRCHSWLSPLLWLQVWFIERQVCFTIDRTVYTFSYVFDLIRGHYRQYTSHFNGKVSLSFSLSNALGFERVHHSISGEERSRMLSQNIVLTIYWTNEWMDFTR